MQFRRRFKQTELLEQRLAAEAKRYRERAMDLPAGTARETLLRRARLAETGAYAHVNEWLQSPGLQAPT